MNEVEIWTDGACKGNPGPGGWGVLLRSGPTTKELYGGERETTNNRMELMAVIQALQALKRPCAIKLHVDSLYVLKGMTEWLRGNQLEKRAEDGDLGGTMRLGAYPAFLSRGSLISRIYGGATEISERHRHRYEININYRDRLEQQGLHFAGLSPDGVLPETVELEGHPWYVGVQYHPELKSRPLEPHPLFASFIEAAVEQSRLV